MTVLLGPNGSSKSKVFDVFAFPSRRFLVASDTGIAKLTKFFGVRSMGAANICTLIHGQKVIVATPQVRGPS